MANGIVFDIKRYAINDGPGIRTAVFFKGCPLKCWWCHNPEGQSSLPQLMFRSNRCTASMDCIDICPKKSIHWDGESITDWAACDHCGLCADICYAGARELIGHTISVDQLMKDIVRDIPYYDQSGGGVTFTGGEPMFQREFLQEALFACKQQGIHTILDSSGYAPRDGFEAIYPLVDLFLFDLKMMDGQKHIKYTCVSNHGILDNLKMLSDARAKIIVRIPLIPGVNDDAEEIESMAAFLAALPYLEGIELMPYHEIGIIKYESLGMSYQLTGTKIPTSQQIMDIEKTFINYRLPIHAHFSGRLS
jgi:pyruvate formate lyase activating enzyme